MKVLIKELSLPVTVKPIIRERLDDHGRKVHDILNPYEAFRPLSLTIVLESTGEIALDEMLALEKKFVDCKVVDVQFQEV